MRIYISGISGTGLAPLALMATEAGMSVVGSDLKAGGATPELGRHNIKVLIGEQTGEYLRLQHASEPIDWFVYSSALPANHPELLAAQELGIARITKRDELTSFLIQTLGLKMVAVAGTHGKTTTTSMLVWVLHQLGLPISYIVGSTLPFATSGHYGKDSQYFIYEADEYDRNFLHFAPWLTLLPEVTYDHDDIYPTPVDYLAAFQQFISQSRAVISSPALYQKIPVPAAKQIPLLPDISNMLQLSGATRRFDAQLVYYAVIQILTDFTSRPPSSSTLERILLLLNNFPGVSRRFEEISAGVYSDYAHHPNEIIATLAMAREEAARKNLKGVIAIYEPHQNTRQHQIFHAYRTAFLQADQIYWLPTFLTREHVDLPILTPEQFCLHLQNSAQAFPAQLDLSLLEKLQSLRAAGYLILLMSAGSADAWLRKHFT